LRNTNTFTFVEYQLPVLLWLMTMFFFSTDTFSAGQTSKFIVPALTFLFPRLSPHQIDFWHAVIRKSGHITEYCVLSLLAYRCFTAEQADPLNRRARTITFVVLAAMLDEWHQSFTASRSASIFDVGYDGMGGVLALCLITAYETWRLRSHPVL